MFRNRRSGYGGVENRRSHVVALATESAQPVRSTAVPPHAKLLRDFVNTYDIDESVETLVDPPALVQWLREHDLLSTPRGKANSAVDADDADVALARTIREALRAEFLAHHDAPNAENAAEPRLGSATAGLTLQVDFAEGGPRLEPVDHGARGALARLAAAAVLAHWDGSWERLKVCPADHCLWAFYDTSKNRSRTWCSMRVCGNRTKTRTYRSRHRGPSGTTRRRSGTTEPRVASTR
jgi:predicted RNA-binding Zn ribbon-like protein